MLSTDYEPTEPIVTRRGQKIVLATFLVLVAVGCIGWAGYSSTESAATVKTAAFVQEMSDHNHGPPKPIPKPLRYRLNWTRSTFLQNGGLGRWLRACKRFSAKPKNLRRRRRCMRATKRMYTFPLHVRLSFAKKLGAKRFNVNRMFKSAASLVAHSANNRALYRLLIVRSKSEKAFSCVGPKFVGKYYTRARKLKGKKYHWDVELVGKRVLVKPGRCRRPLINYKINHLHADAILGSHADHAVEADEDEQDDEDDADDEYMDDEDDFDEEEVAEDVDEEE